MKKSLLLGLGAVAMTFAAGAGIGFKVLETRSPEMAKADTVYTILIEHKALWDGASGEYQLKVDGVLYDYCATAFDSSKTFSVFEVELASEPLKIQLVKGDYSSEEHNYSGGNTIWCPDSLGTNTGGGVYLKSAPYTPTFTATFANAVPDYVDIQLGADFYGYSLVSMSATDGATRKNFAYTSSSVRCWSGAYLHYKVIANYSGVQVWTGDHTHTLWDNGAGGDAFFEVNAASKPLFYSADKYTSTFVFANYFYRNGMYLRGESIGWGDGDQIAMSGSGPYTIKRHFDAGELVKATLMNNGSATWIAVTSTPEADANYFPISEESTNAKVVNEGVYTLSLTIDGSNGTYSFTDTASEWCRTFLDSMTCDPDGLTEPAFKTGYSWSSLSESFDELDDYAKDAIHDAAANEGGSVIQEAVSRYDTIVSNHKYTRFIENSSHELRLAKGAYIITSANNNDSTIVAVTIVAMTSLFAASAYFFRLKAKKKD